MAQGFLNPSDEPYFVLRSGPMTFVYPESFNSQLQNYVEIHGKLRTLYDKEFGSSLKGSPSVVIASSRNQMPNGFATVIPNIFSVFYNGGGEYIDYFSYQSWWKVLTFHETIHLYQLDAKSPFGQIVSDFFGHPYFLALGIVPVFVHPNVLTPRFMMEGNAVLNESRFENGGRLYNGTWRAIFLSLVREKKLDAKRIYNSHLDFPYGEEHYLIGAYWNQMLAQKFGIEKTNQFFRAQGEHWLNPLILDKTFQTHFGAKFSALNADFLNQWKPLALKQNHVAATPPLFSSALLPFHEPLSSDERNIYFLSQGDGRRPEELKIFDKATQTLRSEPSGLSLGRVFKIGDRWASGTTQQVNVYETKLGLFDESLRPIPGSLDKVWLDRKANHEAYFHVLESFDEPILYVDGVKVGTAHSSAILDYSGNVFYMKQNGNSREIWKNSTIIGSYIGSTGKPVDIGADGAFYFIAPTEYGSSLFRLHESKIARVSKLDTFSDAKLISDQAVFAQLVSADGLNYHVLSLAAEEGTPTNYDYGLNKSPIANLQSAPNSANEPQTPNVQAEQKGEPYSGIRNLRYNSLLPTIGYSDQDGFLFSLVTHFSDILNFHQVSLGVGNIGGWSGQAAYLYSRYRLGVGLEIEYDEDYVDLLSTSKARDYKSIDRDAFLTLVYPLIVNGRWSSRWKIQSGYRDTQLLDFHLNYYLQRSLVDLKWSRSTFLGYFPHASAELRAGYELRTRASDWRDPSPLWGGSLGGSLDVFRESVFNAKVQGGASDRARIELNEEEVLIEKNDLPLLSSSSPRVKEFKKYTLGFQQAVNVGLYHHIIPLGLRRFAPFVSASLFQTEHFSQNTFRKDFRQFAAGVNLEILLAHVFGPIRLTVAAIQDDWKRPKDETTYWISLSDLGL